jgi:hypothetical protein
MFFDLVMNRPARSVVLVPAPHHGYPNSTRLLFAKFDLQPVIPAKETMESLS